MKKIIVVPTDLTEASDQAIRQATVIARKARAKLVLLHILDNKSIPATDIEKKLNEQAYKIWEETALTCEVVLKEGSVFDTIPSLTREEDWDLMVIGFHDIKGIRQMLIGPDILKLVTKIAKPVLAIHEKAKQVDNFTRIILPVSSHETFIPAIEAMLFFAEFYPVEVHIYSINKAGFD
jgi:nucleotide-binding universal stress UspA family protein